MRKRNKDVTIIFKQEEVNALWSELGKTYWKPGSVADAFLKLLSELKDE